MGDVSNQDGTDASKTMKTCWELTGNKSTLKGPSCTYEGANKFNKVADSMKWLQCPWRLNLDMATRRKVCVKVKVRIQRKKKNDWDNYCCPLPPPPLTWAFGGLIREQCWERSSVRPWSCLKSSSLVSHFLVIILLRYGWKTSQTVASQWETS